MERPCTIACHSRVFDPGSRNLLTRLVAALPANSSAIIHFGLRADAVLYERFSPQECIDYFVNAWGERIDQA